MSDPRPLALAARTLDGLAPAAIVRTAAEAGFAAVGLLVEPGDWTDATTREVRQALAGTGLRVLDVEVVRIKPGPVDPSLPRLLDIAREVGAGHVLVIGHDEDRARTVAAFRAVCEAAAARGLAAVLEFMAFRGVATLGDALDVVAAAVHPAGAVLVDNHHLARSGAAPEELLRVPPRLLRYVQLCDAPAEPAGGWSTEALLEDALGARCLPGEGELPLRSFVEALPAGVPISVELLGRRVRDRFDTPVAYARAIMRATRGLLDQVTQAPSHPTE